MSVAILVGLSLLVGVLAGIVIVRRRSSPAPASTNYRLMAVENRLLEAEQQLSRISIEIQHLPTAEVVQAMAIKVAEIGGDVKALQGSVTATNRLVERIDQYLIAKGV
jgi:uncharacterized membrane-anchored protein YhcB (DUF1043 family)